EIDFIMDYLQDTDFSGCYECNTCQQAIGTLPEFTQAVRGRLEEYFVTETPDQTPVLTPEEEDALTTFINGLHASLVTQCQAMRATCMASPCSRFEQMMLDDVSPGGQYALFTNDPFTPLEQEINVL